MNKIVKYTKKDIDLLCKSLVIIVDSREKNNKHICDCLSKKNIQYVIRKLDYGDYSFMIKANELIPEDLSFENKIVIERKNSLEELSQNLCQKRKQFENELVRKKDCKFILLIEKGRFEDIFNGNYNTKLSRKAYLASLLTFQLRYNMQIAFIDQKNVYKFICNIFYYYLRENFNSIEWA
jgi:ERCC4-type nuclease